MSNYIIKAEIIHETTGEFMLVEFEVDSIDFGDEINDASVIEDIVSNISVVPLSIKKQD